MAATVRLRDVNDSYRWNRTSTRGSFVPGGGGTYTLVHRARDGCIKTPRVSQGKGRGGGSKRINGDGERSGRMNRKREKKNGDRGVPILLDQFPTRIQRVFYEAAGIYIYIRVPCLRARVRDNPL